ncbi:phosphoglycerate kinase [Akkermansiaceae bacterium]|nr:phosphoglycerate kinase [Akkermansiaceae bacterium]
MSKLTIRDIDVAGQEVLMRADFNVPTNDTFEITDDTRIQAALPTIKQLVSNGARLVLCSHMGRPTEAREKKYSLEPVAARLCELLEQDVTFADDCIGDDTSALRAQLKDGEILLLENTRYYSEEKKNDAEFKKNPIRITGALLGRGAFQAVKDRTNYESYGGSPLLGVNGVVIIAHGGSSTLAIKNALKMAAQALKHEVNPKIEEALAKVSLPDLAPEQE